MLDKFAKLEEKLNVAMVKSGQVFWRLYNKLAPTIVINFFHSISHGIRRGIYYIKSVLKTTYVNSILFLGEAKGWLVYKVNRVLEIRKVFIAFFQSVKSFLLKTPLKTTVEFLSQKSKIVNNKVSAKLNSGMTSQYLIASFALGMITLGLYGVYLSSSKIIEQEYPDRKPASVVEYDEKPEYYYFKEKTLKVQNIKVPLQVIRAGKMDSLTIDFSVRTSTRFARFYLSENEHKLKDYFFTTVEPTVSDFALEEEGKEVLKEKIQREVQNFLDQENVEGTVLEVNILYIVGS